MSFGVIWCTHLKKTCNSKRASRRVKQCETWDLEVVVVCIWGTFDLLVFKVIWGPFSALVSIKMACNWKTFGRRAKRSDIWDSGIALVCMWGTLDLSVFQCHLGVTWRTCLEMACNSKMVGCRAKRSEGWDLGVVIACIRSTFVSFQCSRGHSVHLSQNGL